MGQAKKRGTYEQRKAEPLNHPKRANKREVREQTFRVAKEVIAAIFDTIGRKV